MRIYLTSVALAIILATPHLSLGSEDANKFKLNGFGSWSYRVTDGNSYGGGTSTGAWLNYDLALVASYILSDTVGFKGLGFIESEGVYEEARGSLDFLFAEWRISDAARLRLGKVQQPWGIYNETRRSGILRTFYDVPASIYGTSGFVNEGYVGLGITGTTFMDNDWEFNYDLFYGNIETRFTAPFHIYYGLSLFLGAGVIPIDISQDSLGSYDSKKDNVFGGRASFVSEDGDMEFGCSGMSGELQGIAGPGGTDSPDESTYSLGLHFLKAFEDVTIRSEYFYGETEAMTKASGFFVEADYFLSETLSLAARLEGQYMDVNHPLIDTSIVPELLEHTAISVGAAWYLRPDTAIKISYSYVLGNRFALPTSSADTIYDIVSDDLSETTSHLTIGLQTAF